MKLSPFGRLRLFSWLAGGIVGALCYWLSSISMWLVTLVLLALAVGGFIAGRNHAKRFIRDKANG